MLFKIILVSGPDLPITKGVGQGIVNYGGTDLVVMGGERNKSFYQLSAENGIFKWDKLKPELKSPRRDFVAMTIPNEFKKLKFCKL